MKCNLCEAEMIAAGNFWVCGNHPQPNIRSIAEATAKPAAANPLLGRLPSPIATVFEDLLSEAHPYLALHRLVDAVELTTRFVANVFVSQLYQDHRDFPPTLKQLFIENLHRPTFGVWVVMAHQCLEFWRGKKELPPVAAELAAFWESDLRSYIGTNDGNPLTEVLGLRNKLMHSGRLTPAQYGPLYEAHKEKWLKLLERMAFLQTYELYVVSGGQTLMLKGPHLTEAQSDALNRSDEGESQVYFRQGQEGAAAVNLFPLLCYDEVRQWDDQNKVLNVVEDSCPLMYARYNRKRKLIEFTALSPSASFSQQGLDVQQQFHRVFNLEQWSREQKKNKAAAGPQWDYRFEDRVAELAEGFVGREMQLAELSYAWESAERGPITIVSGQAGIGKSAMLAALSRRLPAERTIPYFFRKGDARCHLDFFYEAAIWHVAQQLAVVPAYAKTDSKVNVLTRMLDRLTEEGKHILFLLDGLDELPPPSYRELESFILTRQAQRNIGFILAGRSLENKLPPGIGNVHVLTPLSRASVRAWLVAELGWFKYDLLERDIAVSDDTRDNRFIEKLIEQSGGLPLYIRYVIDDINHGRMTFMDEDKLPKGLDNYYSVLLDQLKAGNLSELLNTLLGVLTWAKEPLTEAELTDIFRLNYGMEGISGWEQDLQPALASASIILNESVNTRGESGYSLYHQSARDHFHANGAMSIALQRGRKFLLQWCARWKEQDERNSGYSVRHYMEHLYETDRAAAIALARDDDYFDRQSRKYPQEPQLAIKTIRLPLQAAMGLDDSVAFAELYLKHAHLYVESFRQSPWETLAAGNAEKADALLALTIGDQRQLWLGLLAMQERYRGNRGQALMYVSQLEHADALGREGAQYLAFMLAQLWTADDEALEQAVRDTVMSLDERAQPVFCRYAAEASGDREATADFLERNGLQVAVSAWREEDRGQHEPRFIESLGEEEAAIVKRLIGDDLERGIAEVERHAYLTEETDLLLYAARERALAGDAAGAGQLAQFAMDKATYYYDLDWGTKLAACAEIAMIAEDFERAASLVDKAMYYAILDPVHLLPIVRRWLGAGQPVEAMKVLNAYVKQIDDIKLYDSHRASLLSELRIESELARAEQTGMYVEPEAGLPDKPEQRIELAVRMLERLPADRVVEGKRLARWLAEELGRYRETLPGDCAIRGWLGAAQWLERAGLSNSAEPMVAGALNELGEGGVQTVAVAGQLLEMGRKEQGLRLLRRILRTEAGNKRGMFAADAVIELIRAGYAEEGLEWLDRLEKLQQRARFRIAVELVRAGYDEDALRLVGRLDRSDWSYALLTCALAALHSREDGMFDFWLRQIREPDFVSYVHAVRLTAAGRCGEAAALFADISASADAYRLNLLVYVATASAGREDAELRPVLVRLMEELCSSAEVETGAEEEAAESEIGGRGLFNFLSLQYVPEWLPKLWLPGPYGMAAMKAYAAHLLGRTELAQRLLAQAGSFTHDWISFLESFPDREFAAHVMMRYLDEPNATYSFVRFYLKQFPEHRFEMTSRLLPAVTEMSERKPELFQVAPDM